MGKQSLLIDSSVHLTSVAAVPKVKQLASSHPHFGSKTRHGTQTLKALSYVFFTDNIH